ncbi:MAG: hypothetical protein LBI05_11005 [Planctomycetaceae bacterium]|jgi:hypothetical protein|nr:hypothetical protein [Planctomycetaceae bacterium]
MNKFISQSWLDYFVPLWCFPKTKPLSIPELSEALSQKLAKNCREERFLRFDLWWRFNDRIRQMWYWFTMTPEMKWAKLLKNEGEKRLWHENLVSLFELLDDSDARDRLIQAEIRREQGEFDRAMAILDGITEYSLEKNTDRRTCQCIRQCCENSDPFVTSSWVYEIHF